MELNSINEIPDESITGNNGNTQLPYYVPYPKSTSIFEQDAFVLKLSENRERLVENISESDTGNDNDTGEKTQ